MASCHRTSPPRTLSWAIIGEIGAAGGIGYALAKSVPRLTFAGGALIGCAVGFVNVPRIKGVHNAVGSGMLAAEHVSAALGAGRANDELVEYENAWRDSPVGKDLYPVRNVKPLWSKFGTIVDGERLHPHQEADWRQPTRTK
jgi:flavin-dependent dehydrogenase